MQSKYEVDISELIRARKEIKNWRKDNIDAFDAVNSRMQRSAKASALAYDNLGRVMNTTGKATNRLGMQMQQVGYQVGDFAVQVQSGTNAMVALGQQGSQLLGIFGPYGALAGMALAIGTAIVAPMMRAKEGVKEAEDAFKSLQATIDKMQTSRIQLINPMASQELVEASAKRVQLANLIAQKQYESLGYEGQMKELSDNLIASLEKELEIESTKYNGLVQSLRLEEERLQQAKDRKSIAAKYNEYEQDLRHKLIDINELTFLNMRYTKDTAGYKEGLIQYEADLYRRTLMREGLEGENLETLVGQYTNILQQTQALEEYNAKAAARLALEEKLMKVNYIAIDPESQLMEMSLKPSKQSGPKKTKTPKGKKKDALQSLMEQLQLEKELLGVNQDRAKVLRALGEDRNKYEPEAINRAIVLQEEIRKQNELYERQQDFVDSIANSFEDAFMDIVDGTESVKDAFRNMAADIIKQLYRVLVVQQMVGSFDASTGTGSGIAGFIGGLLKRENGGPVSAGTPYLVGERGPELFVPSSNGTVMSNKETMGGTTVVQNINISTGVQQTVRTEIRQLMPQIAESAKAAVAEGKRRGGNYRRALA